MAAASLNLIETSDAMSVSRSRLGIATLDSSRLICEMSLDEILR